MLYNETKIKKIALNIKHYESCYQYPQTIIHKQKND